MRIKESKLRRIIRKTITESLSGAPGISPGDIYKKSELGRLPVEIDPSRHTSQSDPLLDMERAIEQVGSEEGQTREEIRELLQVLHRLDDCMIHGDSPQVCAQKLMDQGLDVAFLELEYILHDTDETGEINQFALQVAEFLEVGY